jgi:DNA-binding transcriptional LysR family regulator
MQSLADYEVDLALVFRPPYLPNFRPLMSFEQRLVAIMPAGHPLAAKPSIRLRDCAQYPVALAEPGIGGRQLLDEALARRNLRFDIVAQSNSFEFLRHLVMRDNVISFQIGIGASSDERRGIVVRELDERDTPRADLVLGQLNDRNLPVASTKFAEQLTQSLLAMRGEALRASA